MTRDELIEEIKQRRSRLRPCGEGSIATVADAVFTECLGLVEQLDSPPAMAWQDEPSGDGHAYVEGVGDSPTQVCYFEPVPEVNHGWEYCTNYGEWQPLNGRRVCPIPAPPALPKRGDA